LAVNEYILIKQNKSKTERKINLINEILMQFTDKGLPI